MTHTHVTEWQCGPFVISMHHRGAVNGRKIFDVYFWPGNEDGVYERIAHGFREECRGRIWQFAASLEKNLRNG